MNNNHLPTDKEIKDYLELTVSIDNYFIVQHGDNDDSALIGLIENGKAYSIMDDNDERAEICIDFLRRYGAPVLKTIEEENQYIAEFNKKHATDLPRLSEIK